MKGQARIIGDPPLFGRTEPCKVEDGRSAVNPTAYTSSTQQLTIPLSAVLILRVRARASQSGRGAGEASRGGRGFEGNSLRDPIAASIAWVTGWLATRFGGATRPRRQGRSYRWRIIRQLPHHPLEIAISLGAIARGRDWTTAHLERITAHARERAPAPPAYYSISSRGVTVRGQRDLVIEVAGQVVRCEQERELVSSTPSAARPVNWRISVDDVDRGLLFDVEPGESIEDVRQRALDHVKLHGLVRLPPEPWSWSVLDSFGVEWWARLEKAVEGRKRGKGLAPHLILQRQPVGAEIEMVWASDRPPRPAALRRIVAVVARPGE